MEKVSKSKLESGAKAPAFTLLDQNDKKIKLSEFAEKKVFVYFYPRANTPGCTVQAKSLSESLKSISKHNVEVIGISPDMPDKLAKFDEKHALNFTLLSDPDKKVALKYGVVAEKTMFGKKKIGIVRSAFLISEKGKIEKTWYKISPKDTVPKLLEELEK